MFFFICVIYLQFPEPGIEDNFYYADIQSLLFIVFINSLEEKLLQLPGLLRNWKERDLLEVALVCCHSDRGEEHCY